MSNLAYQDERKFEIHNGKIVSMSPSAVVNHNKIVGKIYRIFGNYLEGKPCDVFADGVDVHFSEKDVFIPDVMIVCDKNIIHDDGIYGAPDLIVEVLSPSTAKNDRGYKKDVYEKSGVKEYWIIEIKSKSIEVYLLKEGKYVLDEVYSIFPEYTLKKMTEEEKSKVAKEFKTSLFADLTIVLEDIFANLIL